MNNITITNQKIPNQSNFEFCGKYINIQLNYSLDYWNHYFDELSQRHFFILGRPTIEIEEWKEFDNKPSFITRILAKKFQELNLKDFCNQLNGGFTVIIADSKEQTLIVIRDKFGVYPVFTSSFDNIDEIQLATHQDILAQFTDTEIDEVSIAEFLSQGYVMHPNTYYKNLKAIDNGAYLICDFKINIIHSEVYFQFEFQEEYNYNKLKDELITALQNSVKRRTVKYYGNTGVLLSGGADSRIIVCNSDSKVKTFTASNKVNQELLTAQKVAKALNLEHYVIKRKEDTNRIGLTESPKVTGGMTTGGNGTWIDILENEEVSNLDNLLTGDYADWLFKDIAFNVKPVTFFGKKYPLNTFSKFNYNFYGPNVTLNKLLEVIQERREQQFSSIEESRLNELQVKRIIPLSNEYTSSSRLTLQRITSWESIFIDNEVLEVFLKIPAEYKLNGKLYNDVVGKLCEKVKDIPHSNTGVKLGTNIYISSLFQFFNIAKKKLFSSSRQSVYGDNSWGNPKEVMRQDKIMQETFYNMPNDFKNYIIQLLGIDVFSYTIEEIIKLDYHLFYNIISFYFWAKEIQNFDKRIY